MNKKKVEEVKEWLCRTEKFQVEESFKNLSSSFLERGSTISVVNLKVLVVGGLEIRWQSGGGYLWC